MRRALASACLVLALASPAAAGDHPVLMYQPHRIFDIFDVVRARARVGPGIGVDPFDVLDLVAGFFFLDPVGDDF